MHKCISTFCWVAVCIIECIYLVCVRACFTSVIWINYIPLLCMHIQINNNIINEIEMISSGRWFICATERDREEGDDCWSKWRYWMLLCANSNNTNRLSVFLAFYNDANCKYKMWTSPQKHKGQKEYTVPICFIAFTRFSCDSKV